MADLKLIASLNVHKQKIHYTPETLTQDCIDLVEYFDCDNVIKRAIKDGLSLDNIKYLCAQHNEIRTQVNSYLCYAAESGHRELVDYFISKGANNWQEGLIHANLSCNEELVEFFEGKIKKMISPVKVYAINYNFLRITSGMYGNAFSN